MDDSPPEIRYYCELLTNIQQVSISLSYPPSLVLSSTRLHPSKRALLLSYQTAPDSKSRTASLFLPSHILPTRTPLVPSTSYRIPAAVVPSASRDEVERSDNVPWSASYFTDETPSVHCKTCASELIPKGRIKEWKDLPSENWADLMDFWHCHKPDDAPPLDDGHGHGHRHEHENKAANGAKNEEKPKGKYSGYGNVKAKRGEGLVEMMFILVDAADCVQGSVQLTTANPTKQISQDSKSIYCTSCDATLGFYDARFSGYRLMKWSLSMSSTASSGREETTSYVTEQWVASQLLALAESQGARKFMLQREQQQQSGEEDSRSERFQIWLFNPSTVITSHTCPRPTEVVKVYYHESGSEVAANKNINGHAGTPLQELETVFLPSGVYDEIWRGLERANRELPVDIKIWGGRWRTGWLKRFEKENT